MLDDFRSTIGRASQVLPNVDSDFEQACLWIITEASKELRNEGHYESEWKETRFSAHLIGYMRKIRGKTDIGLRIDPENHLYRKEILEGEEDPDTAPRIDIRISGAWVQEDVYYGVEGKILVEKDWGTRREYDLRARYIDTGIDNFVNGRYSPDMSRGCILGYVVCGTASNVVDRINALMTHRSRINECLEDRHIVNDCPDCYRSKHRRTTDGRRIRLYHVLLNFTGDEPISGEAGEYTEKHWSGLTNSPCSLVNLTSASCLWASNSSALITCILMSQSSTDEKNGSTFTLSVSPAGMLSDTVVSAGSEFA